MCPITEEQAAGMDDAAEWAHCRGNCQQGDHACDSADCRARMGELHPWERWALRHPIAGAFAMAAAAVALCVMSVIWS